MDKYNKYISPFSERYSSKEMQYIFSEEFKFKTWRKMWIALAEAEKEMGLDISDEAIEEMKANKDNLNIEVAKEREKLVRHDVMSHVYAYGLQAPKAKAIIHLGATSCYVGDNTDLITMHEALKLIRKKVLTVMKNLRDFAMKYKDLDTLGYTHYQAAQPTTVGKRASLWLQDLYMDLEELDKLLADYKLLGSKGTTGTQASFMELFDNDEEKVKKVDELIVKKLGFDKVLTISGQTYTRKIDAKILNVLSLIAQSAYKFSGDLRLLANLKEIEEPLEKNQIGSSAMPYKRNPMRAERIASISRYIIVNSLNPQITAATQWFERTLDDSANKRIAVSEAFLALDGVLDIYINVSDGLIVYENVIKKHLNEELPFMITENILMECVKRGGDRQALHDKIRVHSREAQKRIKEEGKDNNLLKLISDDKDFNLTMDDIEEIKAASKISGRASSQVEEFVSETIDPILEKNKESIGIKVELNV